MNELNCKTGKRYPRSFYDKGIIYRLSQGFVTGSDIKEMQSNGEYHKICFGKLTIEPLSVHSILQSAMETEDFEVLSKRRFKH